MKKRLCLLLVPLMVGLCIYCVYRQQVEFHHGSPVSLGGQSAEPAPYPADFQERLSRLVGVEISCSPDSAGNSDDSPPQEYGHAQPPPEIPESERGGTLRTCNAGPYPADFLAFGSPVSPQFFHYNLFDCINIPLVRQDGRTGEILPGMAEAWAVTDGRRVRFRLHSGIRYTNGRPLRAADFALGLLLRAETGDRTWQRFRNEAERLEIFGERELCITLRHGGPLAPLHATALLTPAEPGFYGEFGSDYAERYARRVPPGTGAYTVDTVQRGRMIRLRRINRWWGENVPSLRNSQVIGQLEYHFLTDEMQAWEMLRNGRLDLLQTRNIAQWQRMQNAAGFPRHLSFTRTERIQPHAPYGIALNACTLPDINLRRGLMHALDTAGATERIFRGEGRCLSRFTSGYPWSGKPPHPEYRFSPENARAFFAAAGYDCTGSDNILQRRDGTRLSVRLLYPPSERNTAFAEHLVRQAALCGAEIIPEPASWQLCDRQLKEKRHQLVFWAGAAGYHLPDYQCRFGEHAAGHDNPFCLPPEYMRDALRRYDEAENISDIAESCDRVDRLIYDAAVWVPGWVANTAYTVQDARVVIPEEAAASPACDLLDSHFLRISR